MNVPNMITTVRFLLIPVFILLFFSDLAHANMFSFLIILLAGLSDMLDGYLARRNGQVTEMGKLLDPLADKLMMITVIFCFVVDGRVSWLAAGVYFIRDIGMILGSTFFHFRGKKEIPAANLFGKVTTFAFYVVFLMIMFQWPYHQEALWMVIIFSFITTLVYAIVYFKGKSLSADV